MNDENNQTIEHLIDQIKVGNFIISWKAGLTLSAFGQSAVKPLIDVFQDAVVESKVFRSVVNLLRQLGQEALDGVITALDDTNEKVRFGAAYTLGYSYEVKLIEPKRRKDGSESESEFLARVTYLQQYANPLGLLDKDKATTALVKTLKDKVSQVRAEAAKSLGIMGNADEALPALIEILLKDEDSRVRSDVAEALHDLEDLRAVAPLIMALADEDKWVRYSAVRALKYLEVASAFEAVDQLFNQENDEDVSEIAARALIVLNKELAIRVLIEALKNKEVMIRASAASALRDFEEARLSGEKTARP